MIHQMGLQQRYFDYIKNGTKRIELRLYDEKRRQIKIGDMIEFGNDRKEKFQVKVVGLLRYESFEKLFNDFDISILADKSMTKQELLDVLSEFYAPEKQKTLGVIGIRVELI
jgi:ASC-1-like (ASCH) protein